MSGLFVLVRRDGWHVRLRRRWRVGWRVHDPHHTSVYALGPLRITISHPARDR